MRRLDAALLRSIDASAGGFAALERDGSPSPAGPSYGDPVILDSGVENYQAGPDLVVYCPSSAPVSFRRLWRSDSALAPTGSPGLADGWAHNWDLRLRVLGNPEAWSSLELDYPNGSGNPLAVELDGGGAPTGRLIPPAGAHYLASGVPSTTVGQWLSITLTFADQTTWVFTPHPTGVYALTQRGNRMGQTVAFTWDAERRLTRVTDDRTGLALLSLAYDALGHLRLVSDPYGREVHFRHEPAEDTSAIALTEVSQIVAAGTTSAPFRYRYGYQVLPDTGGPAGGTFLLLNAISVPSPTGTGVSTSTIAYDEDTFRVTRLTDGNGNYSQYVYDEDLGLTTETRHEPDGTLLQTIDTTYNSYGSVTSSTCTGCATSTEYHDPNNPLSPTRIVAGDGRDTTFAYDTHGNLTSTTDPRGVTISNTWDYTAFGLGRLTHTDRTVDSTTITLAAYTYYEPSGLPHTVTTLKPGTTDASTVVTSTTYDELGNVLTVVSPGNDAVASMTTTYNYTVDGSYTRSAMVGLPLTVTDNLGHATHFRYDERGNRTEVTDALGHTWRSQYNLAEQLVLSQQPGDEPSDIVVDGSVTPVLAVDLTRDGEPGQVLAVTATASLRPWPEGDPEPGEPFLLSLTPLVPMPLSRTGLALSAALPAGRHRLDSVTFSAVTGAGTWDHDNRWAATLQTRDAALEVVDALASGEITAPGANLLRLPGVLLATENLYLYPGGPNVEVRVLDENAVAVQQAFYRYGLEGELLEVSGATEPVVYAYDALYRQVSLTDGNGNTTGFAYDAKGRLKLIRYPLATADEGYDTTRYTLYDDANRLLRRIDGNDVVTDYEYDEPGGALTAIRYPSASSQDVSFGYDALGRRVTMANSEASHAYAYGDDDRLLSEEITYTGLPAKTVSWTYYDNGSRATLSTPAGTHSSHYDGAGRQTSLVYGLGTASWTWLDNGLVLRQTLPNGAYTEYIYGVANQLTELVNRNASGGILARYSRVTWAATGDLLAFSATVPDSSDQTGSTCYRYNAKRQLAAQVNSQLGGRAWQYDYDAAGNPTLFDGQERTYNDDSQQTGPGTWVADGNGNPSTYGGVALTFDLENRLTGYGSALLAGYRGDGLRSWKETATGRSYYLYDGTQVVCELDQTGAVAGSAAIGAQGLLTFNGDQFQHGPLGDLSVRLGAAGSPESFELFDAWGDRLTSTLEGPFGYRAQYGLYTDIESGLLALGHRFYDPSRGRFLTRDPAHFSGGINLYAYVRSQPTAGYDSTGTWARWHTPCPPAIDDMIWSTCRSNNYWCIGGALVEIALLMGFGWEALSCAALKKLLKELGLHKVLVWITEQLGVALGGPIAGCTAWRDCAEPIQNKYQCHNTILYWF